MQCYKLAPMVAQRHDKALATHMAGWRELVMGERGEERESEGRGDDVDGNLV